MKDKRNKLIMGIVGLILAIFVIGTLNTAVATFSIEESSYKVVKGNDLTIVGNCDSEGLNSSDFMDYWSYQVHTPKYKPINKINDGWETNYFSSGDIKNITDFDSTTYTVLTNESYAYIMTDGKTTFTLEHGIDYSFDGVWIKKSVGCSIDYVCISNGTIGSDSSALLSYTGGDEIYFSSGVNLSYQLVGYAYVWKTQEKLTIADYIDTYGSIDNITLWFNYGYGGVNKNSNDINFRNENYALLLYEFHLFNEDCSIMDYSITNEAGYEMAWGIKETDVSHSKFSFVISVPNNCDVGNYFFTVRTSCGNDTTVISVKDFNTSYYNYIYAIIPLCIGFLFFGIADYIADNRKNPVAFVTCIVVGCILILIGVLVLLDIWGYTSIFNGVLKS